MSYKSEMLHKIVYENDLTGLNALIKGGLNVNGWIEATNEKNELIDGAALGALVARHGTIEGLENLFAKGLNLLDASGTQGGILCECVLVGDMEKVDLCLQQAIKQGILSQVLDQAFEHTRSSLLDAAVSNISTLNLIEHGQWDFKHKETLEALANMVDEEISDEDFKEPDMTFGLYDQWIETFEDTDKEQGGDLYFVRMNELFLKQLQTDLALLESDKGKPFLSSKTQLKSFIMRNLSGLRAELRKIMLEIYEGKLPTDYLRFTGLTCHYHGNRALVAKFIDHGFKLDKRDAAGFSLAEQMQDLRRYQRNATENTFEKRIQSLSVTGSDEDIVHSYEYKLKNRDGVEFASTLLDFNFKDLRKFVIDQTAEYKSQRVNGQAEQLASLANKIAVNERNAQAELALQAIRMKRLAVERRMADARMRRHSLDLASTGVMISTVADLDHNKMPLILRDKFANDFQRNPALGDFFIKVSSNIDGLILGSKVVTSEVVVANQTRNLQQKFGALLNLAIQQIPLPGMKLGGMIAGYLVQGRSNAEDNFRYKQLTDLCSRLDSDLVLAKNLALISLHQFQDDIIKNELNQEQVDVLAKIVTGIVVAEIIGHKFETMPPIDTMYTRIGQHLDSVKSKLLTVIKEDIKAKDGLVSSGKNYVNAKLIERKFTK